MRVSEEIEGIPNVLQLTLCLGAVLGGIAKLFDAFQLPLEEGTLHVESSIIDISSQIRRRDDEVVDFREFLAWCVAEEASPSLNELARVGGTGEKKAHA